MRKVLLLIFASVISLSAEADGISVASFKLLETDLTANMQGTSKKDQNGETAALIKIVTSERDFTFNGGSLGIVGSEYKNGEIWLYVPRHAQKLTISHQSFGVLRDYFYPLPIQGGRTYEMLLDIGIGRYVTITTSMAQANVTIDGESVGKSPIYNRYLTFGKHSVVAQRDLYEGTKTINIVPTDSAKGRVESIEMRDMSSHYGNVTVNVEDNAEIYHNDVLVGKGSWTSMLKEGTYMIETRKADCDPAKTTFTVRAQENQRVDATPPTPHTGYLSIYTRPANTRIHYNGGEELYLQSRPPLPIGTYQIEFSRKGYISQSREYTIRHNQVTTDTVTLHRVNYVRPMAFYFGGGYTYQTLSGATGIIGFVLWNNDIQASYTFGLTESDPVYWDGDMNTATKYKMNSISVKYGYQIALARKLGFTPQLGYTYNKLTASAAVAGNTIYGDGATSQALSVGAKLIIVPVQHLYLFVAPEYSFKLSQDNTFKTITESSNFSGEGFGVHAGLLISF
ncbi:MAG: PEGA domain-containing protein [Prevotella sp.]|nr:PEGA domain-containing protein [Prevotella sp.]